MTPENKVWIKAMKQSVKEYPGAKDIHRFIEIIESQEKEIERLKAQLKEGIEIMRAAGGFFEKIIGNENQKIKV